MERDQLLKARDDDFSHLVELYVKPLKLTPSIDTVKVYVEANQPVTREPISLRTKVDGPIDKSDVSFTLVRAWKSNGSGIVEEPVSGKVLNQNGDGVLSYPPVAEGTYYFEVAGYKKRIIRDGDNMKIAIRDTSYTIPYSERLEQIDRDTTILIARVGRNGITPLQFTMNVQEPQEHWVLGPPYRKKIFVGGVDAVDGVTFSSPQPARIEHDGRSFITLVWDNPSLGRQNFRISGDAHRGLGERDRGSVEFEVEVMPPSFVSQPAPKGYWGVPFLFDGKIAGLNPFDLSVAVLHDGQILTTHSSADRDTVVPQKNWKSLKFQILYHGYVIKEHPVALAAPPPPQIRWLQQSIDRANNVFTVSVSATDAIGGAVRMSLEAQPAGTARLDKIKGKTFDVAVNLTGKPSAVFLKLSAFDQYGGSTVSTKQFNIPE
jgi:hypothetical protein